MAKKAKKTVQKAKKIKPPFNGSRRGLAIANQITRFRSKFPMSKTTAEQYFHYATALKGVATLLEAEALSELGHKTVTHVWNTGDQED